MLVVYDLIHRASSVGAIPVPLLRSSKYWIADPSCQHSAPNGAIKKAARKFYVPLSSVQSFLKYLELSVGKWLPPVELELVGIAIGIQLFERLAKRGNNFAHRPAVRENQVAFGCVPLVGRILVDLHKQIFAVAN